MVVSILNVLEYPNSIPNLRTSSLNNVLIGSINSNSMSSGNPPTLWCDLIVCAVLVPDSMTSVYSVPCARKSTPFSFDASSSNTYTNSLPMILRFVQDLKHLLIYS